MRHRLAVPYPHQLDQEWGALTAFLRQAGWRMCEYRVNTGRLGPALLMVDITPAWIPHAIELRVVSGTTLIYDDVEQSLGVTQLAEPQDAVPPPAEGAKPRIPLTELFDDPALRGGHHEERRRRFRP